MLDLAEKVLQKTGSSSKLRFEPLPQDDPKQRQPDISKAKRELNWEPKVSLDEGLELSIDYFRSLDT
jgi:UDP-glucuronate decarboxylase